MTPELSSLLDKARHRLAISSGARQLHNLIRFGTKAPRPHMRLTIHPDQITRRHRVPANNDQPYGNRYTGMVVDGDWDQSTALFDHSLKHKSCRDHFLNGVPWAETQAIPYGLRRIAEKGAYDGCRNKADLEARYANLDTLWQIVQATGELPLATAAHTDARSGILVHVTRDGELLFANQGFHRLSIAKLANLNTVTVVLGAVHTHAVRGGAFSQLLKAHSA